MVIGGRYVLRAKGLAWLAARCAGTVATRSPLATAANVARNIGRLAHDPPREVVGLERHIGKVNPPENDSST
jgi:hypothetical protein